MITENSGCYRAPCSMTAAHRRTGRAHRRQQMHITEATENYMEAILVLDEKNGMVRSADVANYLGFAKPTISQYMKQFVQQGLVEIGTDGYISLTEAGRSIAEHTLEKHRILFRIFIAMGVSEDVALKDACKVEHDLSDETFECLERYYFSYLRKGL